MNGDQICQNQPLFRQTAGTASKNASNLYKFTPDFHNKCQKTQLDLCMVYTQEAKSGSAELRRVTGPCVVTQ
jgi:hypothetical protein